MFKNIWTPSQSHAKPRAAEGPWATPALRPFPIMPSPQHSDQRISLEQTDHHMVQHVFLVCPCLSFQVHPKMVSLSWFHSCFLFLWLIMSYSWFIYIFVSWFVMVCVYLLVDLCLFSHVLSFSWLFWFPWDGRQGSTTVMLMLQTVSSPMAMSLPMPSTWTMDDWRRTKSWIYWEFTGNYWENPILRYGNPYYDRELRRIPWELFISFHGMNRCVLLLICVPYWMIIQYNHDESSFCLHGSGGINKFESGWQYPEAN